MKKKTVWDFCIASGLLILFVLWTLLIQYVDVQAIGPGESAVGFATINNAFHNLTGVDMLIYTITDWLGFVPLLTMVGFAVLGLVQLIKRKSLLKVDYDILVLGGFYIIVLAAYVLFEVFVVNYRPILINGFLEASYPSSTTLLVLCVMPTAMMQFNQRTKNPVLKKAVEVTVLIFTAFMVIGRLVSGVHWLTDILGGAILSGSLVMIYRTVSNMKWKHDQLLS